jgi:hypothetical protein
MLHAVNGRGICEDAINTTAASDAVCALVRNGLFTGLVYFCVTSVVVLIGVFLSTELVSPQVPTHQTDLAILDRISSCIRCDGCHYRDIVVHGYDYDSSKRSTVAFFPIYPLVTRLLSYVTGWPVEVSLLMVSNSFLALAFVLLAIYVHIRPEPTQTSQIGWVLLAFGLWPSTFFFRMAYAESLFVCTALLTLIGILRCWSLEGV